MSEDTRARAFDPFFTTKPPDRGSGLGLATVQAVVSQAEGHVRLISEPGCGTRCELYWPLAAEPDANAASRKLARTESDALPHARVLLVEDEAPIRTALARGLADAGHFVAEACDTEHALATLEDAGGRFDVLITDVVMRHSSGLDLAARVIERWPVTKVVLISGYLRDYSIGDLDSRFAFLAKPFSPKDLQEKVREVLAHSFEPDGSVEGSADDTR
jgi:CheY-like chemotaxis protein